MRRVTLVGTIIGITLFLCIMIRSLSMWTAAELLQWCVTIGGIILVMGVGGFIWWKVIPYVTKTAPAQAKPAIHTLLRTAFTKNYTVRVHKTLQTLPDWPIRALLQDTAQHLFALKFAVQRARDEGVSLALLERIQSNIDDAANGTWQIASKIDAVAQQGVAYPLIESKLHSEAEKLQHLMIALQQSHEGIALLTLSGTHHETIQNAHVDLSALADAIRRLEHSML